MEAQLRMRVQYDQPFSNELQAPFVNVLPNEPLQAYKQFDEQKLSAIKKTQKIPFSSLRQLILMYILQSGSVIDIQQSQLLKEKLLDEAYLNDHHFVNSTYDELLKEKDRLQKLYEVTHKYIEMREKLVSNELRRTMHRRYDGSELGSLLSSLEQKKDSEMRLLQQKIEQSLKSGGRIDADKEKMKIEEQYNHEVLLMFEDQLPKLQKLSSQFHENLQNVNWFKLYIEDFQKSLVFIISVKKINNKVGRRAQQRLLKDSFQVELVRSINELGHILDRQLQKLFQWRTRVKYGRVSLQQKQVHENYGIWMQRIEQNVYELIPDIINILKADKETIKMVESQITKQYSIFLSGYYDAKEVSLFYKKESKIEQILEKQRQLLIDHLKKNYSMMVFYSKSADYMSCIEQYKSKSKGYLKDILKKKIGLLDIAITFINKQYGELYKEACDGRSGTRDRIVSKCRALEEGLKESQTILTLLMQSCRRLLNIASK